MLLIKCPFCGDRPEIEFRYAGEAHIARPTDPDTLDDEEWAAYLYERSNPSGAHAERWHHIYGCRRFFNAIRNTLSDMFIATYEAGEIRPNLELDQ
jgi:sarcosine oxidase, subunit delta